MVWPSLFLIIASLGFAGAGAAALIFQFSSRPPALTTPLFSFGLIVGTAMLAVSLLTMRSEPAEEEDVSWIVRLTTGR